MYKYICAACAKLYNLKKSITGYECEGYCKCGGTVEYQNPYLGSNLLRDSYTRKIKTIGQQADDNVRRNGRAWAEDQLRKQKTEKKPAGDNSKRPMDIPDGGERRQMEPTKIDKDLVNASAKEIERYIMTGERPTPKAQPTEKEMSKLKKEKAKEKRGKATKIISTGK